MGYHPRIESKTYASFLTTRSKNSEMWFINNPRLEEAILASAAKCRMRYEVKLYALAIEGNHNQGPAHFPKGNRAAFMRDFNSAVARAVPRYTPEYNGGRFWARRYSAEFLPAADDIEDRFFYTVLQPVQDGLVRRISEYPGYNCFYDAVRGRKRKFKVVRWGEYNAAARSNPLVPIEKFTETVILEYERIPGYENLSQEEYAEMMIQKLKTRQDAIARQRAEKGLGFVGRDRLQEQKRGARPRKTKTSGRYDHRPRVLSICPKRRRSLLDWYFRKYFEYRDVSMRYRAGELDAVFPDGMYPPWRPVMVVSG